MDADTHRFLFKEETINRVCDVGVLNYLKITGLRVGLLLNLKYAKLQQGRVVL